MAFKVAIEPSAAQIMLRVRPGCDGVEPMSAQDIPFAAEMAVRLLPASLLAQLGLDFMAALYRAALDHPATVALKIVDPQARALGFCLASVDADGFQRSVRPRLLTATARALASPARMRLIPHLLRGLVDSEPEPLVPAELLLLYVDGTCQRQGSGRRLILQLEAELARRGVRQYRVAVRSQLASARAFYLAMGFRFEQERQVLGEPMTYFTREI